jgi:hypothetical protein
MQLHVAHAAKHQLQHYADFWSIIQQMPATTLWYMLHAGAGRAGKAGCLAGSKGSMYKGQVLAGRPHGKGQYWAPVSSTT